MNLYILGPTYLQLPFMVGHTLSKYMYVRTQRKISGGLNGYVRPILHHMICTG